LKYTGLGDDDWSSDEHRTAWEDKISKTLISSDHDDKPFVNINEELNNLYEVIMQGMGFFYHVAFFYKDTILPHMYIHSCNAMTY